MRVGILSSVELAGKGKNLVKSEKTISFILLL